MTNEPSPSSELTHGQEHYEGSITPAVNAADLLNAASSSAEPEASHPEVIHNAKTDIIINPDSLDAEWSQRLAEVWANGKPEDWTPVPGVRKRNVFIGEVDGRTFLVKYRLDVPTNQGELDELRNQHPHIAKAEEAQANVQTEMDLAPDVRSVLESETIQALAEAGGMASVEFVEPIIGVVDRTEREDFPAQAAVYRYVPDLGSFTDNLPDVAIERYNDLIRGLRDQLQKAGIVPADLSAAQVMTDPGRKGYLLDAAKFYRGTEPAK